MLQTKSSSAIYKVLTKFLKPITVINVKYPYEFQSERYYAKKAPALTEAQIQFQKLTKELSFREKTSIRGTRFQFNSVETSIQYMQSKAFKQAYGNKLIWEWYIRNFKGRFAKSYTRKECIINELYATGNPCPICRDSQLVVSYKNVELLKQFVSPFSGYLYPTSKTNVCRKQHENLEIAFKKACDHGLIEHNIPHRVYDYSEYFSIDELKDIRNLNIDLGVSLKKEEESQVEKPSILLGVVLGANRKNINKIYTELDEDDIVTN